MRATVYHGPLDVRVEEVPDSRIEQPTDALVRITHALICGSDLWFYRGYESWTPGWRLGHEFVGVVEDVGGDVSHFRRGDRVIAPFNFSDGTCTHCADGLYTSCLHADFWGRANDGGQAEAIRVPYADGTLVRLPASVADDPALLRAALPLTDVMCTGHHAAVCAGVGKGSTVVVVGDGAVGLCGVLASARLGAERIVAVGHHQERLAIAIRFGATDVVDSRSGEAAETLGELTGGGAPCVIEAVGTQSSLELAVGTARPGGRIGMVGAPQDVTAVPIWSLFARNVTLSAGVAPARRYIPELLEDVAGGRLDPSALLDLETDLDGVPDAYQAMHERRAIKALITIG